MAKFCSECGKPLVRENSPFCSECGAELPVTTPIEQSPEIPPAAIQQPVQAPPPSVPPPHHPVQALQSQRAYSINYVLYVLLIVGIFLIVIIAETVPVIVVLGASAIVVYYDAVAIDAGKSAQKEDLLQLETYKPISWAVLTFLLLPLFLSLYLYKREAIFRQNTSPQQPVQVLPATVQEPAHPSWSIPPLSKEPVHPSIQTPAKPTQGPTTERTAKQIVDDAVQDAVKNVNWEKIRHMQEKTQGSKYDYAKGVKWGTGLLILGFFMLVLYQPGPSVGVYVSSMLFCFVVGFGLIGAVVYFYMKER